MKSTHPFHYPFVIKQVGEFITVSVPDFEVTVSATTSRSPKVDKDYVTVINSLMIRAARRVLEKMSRLEDIGKKHYRPASFVRHNIQADQKDKVSTSTAAKYLGVSQATLKRWELAGHVKAIKTLGGHRAFVMAELNRLKEQMAKPSAAKKLK